MNIEDKKILIIDDTEFHRVVLSDMLKELGFHNILIAEDGLEGVRMARYYKPDLILLDLEMPNVDGYESCEKIRLFSHKVTMPIIVITAKERQDSLERVFELGANDYFEKPFHADEIASRIFFYLGYCDVLQNLNILKEDIQNDLAIAKSVHDKIIPSPDKMKGLLTKSGLDFYAFHQASIGLGGDIWNVYMLDSGDPVFLLCDISGHGMNAAINGSFIVSTIKSSFQFYKSLSAKTFDPKVFLERLNFILSAHMQAGTFCAAACLVFDTEDKSVTYAGCALPSFQYIHLHTGAVESLSCKGLPIGVSSDDLQPSTGVITLGKGDILLCMSDGLIESKPPSQRAVNCYAPTLPGEDILNHSIKNLCNAQQNGEYFLSAQNFLDSIVHDFEAAQHVLKSDDVTLLAFRLMV